jgi:hypothetical protein
MEKEDQEQIERARLGALHVLKYNAKGPFDGLPRTAGWGYPEPYSRDLLISIFGIAVSGDQELMQSMRMVLETLAKHQTAHGHIPSLVHDQTNVGASDTTPLFLLAIAVFRWATGEKTFLNGAAQRAILWMEFQSPSDQELIAQQPTTDWRDEQWVMGYGLYVNALTYGFRRFLCSDERSERMLHALNRSIADGGLLLNDKPYYALWSFKVYHSDRFDLLGNSLCMLFGLCQAEQTEAIIEWVEQQCEIMQAEGKLAVGLPPNLFPFILPEDPDWLPRYKDFNLPGDYHNGGIWPFICGFYIAGLVKAGRYKLAEEKLLKLTAAISLSQDETLEFGFNEWIKAQDGIVKGVDWQTWSAALYLYAAKCVELRETPFF